MAFHLKAQTTEDTDPFERQSRIDWWDQNTLRSARIMVIGAGALGNETLKNLALLGVGGLFIVDFDTISGSNLSRTVLFRKQDIGREKAAAAAEAIRSLALETTAAIEYYHGDMVWELGLGAYRRMDVVLSCVDNDEARLATNRACRNVGVPWINAGIHGLSGNIMVFDTEGACYECNVTPDQIEDARSRYDSCENVRKRYLQQERMPTVQVTSALISALQTQEAIKILHNQQPAFGKRIVFNGLTNGYSAIILQPLDECLAHGRYEEIKELPLSAHQHTLAELLTALDAYLGTDVTIELGRRFISEIRCRYCGKNLSLMRPAHRIFDDELICQDCHQGRSDSTHTNAERIASFTNNTPDDNYVQSIAQLDHQSPPELQALKLWDLGMPPLHIFTARNSQGVSLTFELSADAPSILGSLAGSPAQV